MTDLGAYQGKIAGAALLLSLVSLIVGVAIIAVQGKLGGVAASFSRIEGFGDSASALSTLAKAGIPMMLLQVVGFGALAAMLSERGERSISTVSFGLLLLALAMSSFRTAFDGTVTVWAAMQAPTAGSLLDLIEALREWPRFVFEISYVAYFAATAGFGWGILRTGLAPGWVGWVSIAWSALWIVGYFFRLGLPAFVLFPPLLFGVALLAF